MPKEKASLVISTKEQIIVHLLDYIENNDEEEKKQAIEKLIAFAKFYKISLKRKKIFPNVKIHLREFILNKTGYLITILNLYNSLIYDKK